MLRAAEQRVSLRWGASPSSGFCFVQPPPCAQPNSFAVGQAAVSVCPGAVMGRMTVRTTVMKKTVRTQVESPRGAPGPSPHVGSGRPREKRAWPLLLSWPEFVFHSLSSGLDVPGRAPGAGSDARAGEAAQGVKALAGQAQGPKFKSSVPT